MSDRRPLVLLLTGGSVAPGDRVLVHARALSRAGLRVAVHGVRPPALEPEEDVGDVLVVRTPRAGGGLGRVRWFRRNDAVVAAAFARHVAGRAEDSDAPRTVVGAYGVDVSLSAAVAARRAGVPLFVCDDGAGEALRAGTSATTTTASGLKGGARARALRVLARREDRVRRRVARSADVAVAPSRPLAAHLASLGARGVVVVRDALEPAGALDPGALRVRVGAYPGERLLWVGGRPRDSDVLTPVRALRLLGDGHVMTFSGWDEARADVEDEAEALGVARLVRFLPPMPRTERIALLHGADLVLLPHDPPEAPDRLGIPGALFEAVAGGTPLVASNLPALELVTREHGLGSTWEHTTPPDARAVAEAISAACTGAPSLAVRRSDVERAARGALSPAEQTRPLVDLVQRLAAAARGA